jgi:hypothetical protein
MRSTNSLLPSLHKKSRGKVGHIWLPSLTHEDLNVFGSPLPRRGEGLRVRVPFYALYGPPHSQACKINHNSQIFAIILPEGTGLQLRFSIQSSGFLQNCRRDGRVAEGARLESVFRGNSNVGSNPTLSAISPNPLRINLFCCYPDWADSATVPVCPLTSMIGL